jgi:hypothetical protein
LGYYNFDGASIRVRPLRWLGVDVFGGWSLLRGLNEAVNDGALAAIEPLAPDAAGLLFGAEVRARPSPAASITALYQREIRDDRSALYSERVAVDGLLRRGRATLTASLEADLGADELNDARATLRFTPLERTSVSVFARTYRPYFDLWTIWGAFDPVGFDETGATASWQTTAGRLQLRADGAWRRYAETGAELAFAPLRDEGWRLGLLAAGRPAPGWDLSGAYRADVGFGAAGGELSLQVRRTLSETAYAALHAIAFERAYEFRVAQGSVIGIGASGSLTPSPRSRLTGDLTVYRQLPGDAVAAVDWSQLRASLRWEWTVGAEPAAGRGGVR